MNLKEQNHCFSVPPSPILTTEYRVLRGEILITWDISNSGDAISSYDVTFGKLQETSSTVSFAHTSGLFKYCYIVQDVDEDSNYSVEVTANNDYGSNSATTTVFTGRLLS